MMGKKYLHLLLVFVVDNSCKCSLGLDCRLTRLLLGLVRLDSVGGFRWVSRGLSGFGWVSRGLSGFGWVSRGLSVFGGSVEG